MRITHNYKALIFLSGLGDPDDVQARGYLSHVLVEVSDGQLFPVTYYDPVRLQQDLELSGKHGRAFVAEVGMIIVPEVTAPAMETAARALCAEGFFAYLTSVDRSILEGELPQEWPPPRMAMT